MNHRTVELAATQAWILAGGEGKRLQPLTVSRPKPAVSFGGMFRIVDFTLENCLYSGLRQVSIVTQYQYPELHRHIRTNWSEAWNDPEELKPSPLMLLPPVNGKRYRGTADAIYQNSELLQSESAEFVLILAGDHIYQMDYLGLVRQHAETGADLTIATVEFSLAGATEFGVLEVDTSGKVIGFEEKPQNPRPMALKPESALVSMGIYIFRKKVLMESLRHFCETGNGYDFGHNLIPWLIRSGCTYAYDFQKNAQNSTRYWRDIGTLDAYYEASMDLVDSAGFLSPRKGRITPHSMYADGSGGIKRSVLSPDIELADDVRIEDSVVMPGVRIGKGARLYRTIVDEGVQIPAHFNAGFDLDQDRQHYTVTPAGIVVVSSPLRDSKSTILKFDAGTHNARKPEKLSTEEPIPFRCPHIGRRSA